VKAVSCAKKSAILPPQRRASDSRLLPSDGGFVLLVTLLIILLLSVMIFEIDSQARADLRAAVNFRDDLAAYYLALSGVTLGKDILREDSENQNEPWDAETDIWATPVPSVPLGEGTVSGAIQDESAKININQLIGNQNNLIPWRKEQLQRLFRLLEVNPDLVDAMIDWIDKDDQPGTAGAENETYQFFDPPYTAKNGPMETLEELRFIKGMSPDVYEKIIPYLTIYTGSDMNGGKINVNTVDPIILQTLHDLISEEVAQQLMSSRPYSSTSLFKDRLGAAITNTMNVGLFNALDFRSNVFSMEAIGTVSHTKKVVHAVWDRQQKKLLYLKVE